MRHSNFAAVVSIAVCALGCGSRDSRLEADVTVVDIAPLGTDLAYLQSSGVLQRVNVVADVPKPETTKTNVRSGPWKLAKRPQPAGASVPEELLVLSRGVTDTHGQVLEMPALTAISVNNEERVYELSQPNQRLRLSDDGNYAVLFDNPDFSNSDALLTNRNEIAIVDLSKAPVKSDHGNPVIRTLDAVGGTPQDLWFANLNGIGNFVMFSFPKGVSLSQLTDPSDHGHKIELTTWVPGAGSNLAPVADAKVDSDTGNTDTRKIYLRNDASPDVQVISVSKDKDTGAIGVSQNTLTVGTSAPTDFLVYSLPVSATDPNSQSVSTRLLATVGKQVAVVAADSNTVTAVPISYLANHILPYTGTSPKDDTVKQRALLYAPDQTGVTFVDLEDLEAKTTKALQAVDLGATLRSVLQLPSLPNSLVLFMNLGGVEVLDLQTRRWSPFGSNVAFTTTMVDPSQYRTWVAASGDDRVGYVNFDFGDLQAISDQPSLSIGNINLDDPIEHFFRIDSGGVKKGIVTHNRVGGSLTIFEAVKPERATSKKLEGFLLSNLL